MVFRARLVGPVIFAVALVFRATPSLAQEKITYNRDIRPILSNNCFLCHGRDEKNRKAKLRLDVRDLALKPGKSGNLPIVPGKPDESAMVRRIFSDHETEIMPPPQAHKKLTAKEKETLKSWIAEGAEYQDHWAYITPTRPRLPQVKQQNLVRNPIDAFILAELEARQMTLSPEADKRTLLRRLSLDLIGLPPTLGEMQDFLKDNSPEAFERQVHRLLDSPHFGERMAVPWLDVARFADTVGYHGDQNQRIFPYRDYVIDAFNHNKPFDQFTVEQLAGDLLPNPTTEQLVATGFNRLNMMTREGGAQPKEYLARYAADRVRTVGMAWLGSTLGCCECHDHKFDPFTMRDFYSLAAFFADLKQWGVYQDYEYTPNPELRGWSNDHPFPPEIEVDSPYLRERQDRLRHEIEQVCGAAAKKLEKDNSQKTTYENWLGSCREFLKRSTDGWLIPPAASVNPKITSQPDGSMLFGSDMKAGESQSIELRPGAGWIAAIRLELLPNKVHKESISRTNATPFVQLSAAVKSDKTKNAKPLTFFFADANFKEDRFANGYPLLGVAAGWKTSGKHKKEKQTSVWLLQKPVLLENEDRLVVSIKSDQVGCVRLAVSPFFFEDLRAPRLPAGIPGAMALATDSCSPDQKSLLSMAYLEGTAWDPIAHGRIQKLWKEIYECTGGRAFTMICQARVPQVTRVLPRGNWQDENGAIVQPAVPHSLPQPAASDHARRLTRLDLARWLTSPENPLTARVEMNRIWKQFFGAGLCGSIEDVGFQGETCSHPELLDWLAVEFRESGWNIKHMVELMVLSSTYRQASNLRPELREIDPANRLLASQSPRRLDAEFVRDNALAIARLLNLDIGGPSVHPYQPAGYYVNLQFPDRDYVSETDDRQYRRGIYMHWQRTFLQPMLANFDAPSREDCIATRNAANTPQQALTLLNDPTYVEAARSFAQRLLSEPHSTDTQKIDRAYQLALARPAEPKESKSLLAFLEEQRRYYSAHPDDAKKLDHAGIAPDLPDLDSGELAAWANLCRVILNLHETITRY
jgi:hypothetical protein